MADAADADDRTREGATARAGRASGTDARAIAAWREHDTAHALHAVDAAAIAGSDPLRSLVLELLARPTPSRDLYSACARLGRSLADAGASPSLAIATLDGAAAVLAETDVAVDAARRMACRAALAEGYLAVVVDLERGAARRAWDYPACAVRVAADAVAIVPIPCDDAEVIADWAARAALGASKERYKRAILPAERGGAGGAATQARSELEQALALVGITVETVSSGASGADAANAAAEASEAGKASAPGKSWFTFWRRPAKR